MRAAIFNDFGNPLVVKEILTPEPAENEVVVKIHASGICDTDCRMSAIPNPMLISPRTLGHQIAGRIHKVGSAVSNIEIGCKVIVNFLIACGKCKFCLAGADSQCDQLETIGVLRDGGFAEYVAVPGANALPVPESLDMVEASFLGCGLATPLRALRQGRLQKDDVVLLIGEGLWTLGAIDLCRAFGARPLLWSEDTDFIQKAQAFGVEDTTALVGEDLGNWLAMKSGGFGADLVVDFEAVPETVALAQSATGKGGRCVFVGHAGGTGDVTVSFPMLQFMETEITGSCLIRADEVRELITMTGHGKLNLSKLITEIISLDDINSGLSKVSADSSLGIVVRLP